MNLPHPFDLEIQEFSSYALTIDARSPHEFEEDHLPGAINLPVVNDDEYAEVGTLHRTDKHRAYVVGVGYSMHNIGDYVRDIVSKYSPGDRMLVYCFRGGKRSKLWADALRTIGFRVDVLPGGWKAYRRWVRSALDYLPLMLDLRVLTGPTGAGKTRLLTALSEAGAQVIDLEGLARHRGSLIGAIPGEPQPSQKAFDSTLLDRLRHFSVEQPVWIEAESKKIGQVQMPQSLFDKMHSSPTFRIKTPMAERVRLWHEDYPHFESDPETLLSKLQPLLTLVGKDEIANWHELANRGAMSELFERLMTHHYDPAYDRSTRKHYRDLDTSVELAVNRLDSNSLREFAEELIKL